MNKFFTHLMRPFSVGAAALAIFDTLVFFISPVAIVLHHQILLELMLPAAYGGFLTVAMLEWMGHKDRLKPVATLMMALLLVASALLPFTSQTASFLVAAYWLVLLLFCVWLIWLDRNTDSFALLMLLATFTAFQTAYVVSGDLNLLRAQMHLNMTAAIFVSVRVSVLLGAEALKGCRLKDPVFVPNVVYKNVIITFLLLHATAELWLPTQTTGFTTLAVGFILLAKPHELHHHELLRKHYVRTYYLFQLSAAAGYLWTGAAKLQNLPTSVPLHLITLGGMMGGMMMVWLTAGLWHNGFTKLDYPKLCHVAVPILFAAAVPCAVLMNVNPILFITVPAILAAAVFVLYLLTFVLIFRANTFTDDPE